MTTLAAISFNLVGGMGVFAVTLTAFGLAVKRQNTFVAARCEARPRNVVYNPNPMHPCQNRGNPTLGWILWVMRLTYDTMLQGVPGTGTRDGGLSGALLKVNLDGIVLLRFHHLCLRVSCLAAVLYLMVVLPLLATSQCSRIKGDYDSQHCQKSNLTDYQRLTLANIPTLTPGEPEDFGDVMESFFKIQHDGDLARLYAVVFCAWIVTWYALRELQVEWGDVLAMRRVYYLEADHWSDRNEELRETLLRDEREKSRKKTADAVDESYMTRREPYVPHPEQRDTVPNVELYSILVGGLPALPTEAVTQQDIEAIFSRKQSIDWQLSVTTAFFDHCVPNQPGFSSSVAAVTILPSAHHLTEAWNQWYNAASKLRRLRFIRRQIADRRRYEIDDDAYPEDDDPDPDPDPEQPPPPNISPSIRLTQPTLDTRQQTVYTESEQKKLYYQEVLGSNTDLEVENNLLHALDFGPEQTAVYSREFALGAANLAPNGFFEGRIKRAGIDELLTMEKAAVTEVHEANQALRKAQVKIAESSSAGDMMDLTNDDMEMIMKTASTHISSSRLVTKSDTPHAKSTSGRRSSRGNLLSITDHSKEISAGTLGYSTDGDEDSFADNSEEYTRPMKDDNNDSELDSMDNIPKQAIMGRSTSVPVKAGCNSDESNDGGKRRSMMSEAGKQLSFLSWTGLKRNNSYEDLKEQSPTKRPQRASIESAQLPGDLGLEAGLWIEQKNLSLGTSQHMPRIKRSGRRPTRNSLSESMHGSYHATNRRAPPRRTRSSDDIDLFSDDPPVQESPQGPKRISPRRTKSSDDIVMTISWHEESSISSSPMTMSLRDMQASLKGSSPKEHQKDQPASTSDQQDVPAGEATREDGKESPSTDSIWSRLEKDKERKQKIRERLNSMQSSTSGANTSRQGTIDQGGSSKSFAEMPELPGLKSLAKKTQDTKDRGNSSSSEKCGLQETENGNFIDERATQNRQRIREYRSSNSSRRDHHVSAQRQSWDSNGIGTNDEPRNQNGAPAKVNRTLQSVEKAPSFAAKEALPPLAHRMSSIKEKKLVGYDGSLEFSSNACSSKTGERSMYDMSASMNLSKISLASHPAAEENLRIAYTFEAAAHLIPDDDEEGPRRRLNTNATGKWSKVMTIVQDSSKDAHFHKERLISSGRWRIPTCLGLIQGFTSSLIDLVSAVASYCSFKRPELMEDLARDSAYAVVTFTSRQAAVAARHCLADSRGADRWVTVSDIPSPPLADAPACNMSSFRGCVRPVTMSISDKQKLLRHQLAMGALAMIYFFYTIPLTAAQQLVSPERLSNIFPDIEEWQNNSVFLANIFSGFIPALVWTAFFAICPPLFKIVANFGSNATSSVNAENSALHYFWWFMLISAFTGASFSTAVINGFNEGLNLGSELQKVIEKTAETIPTQVSAIWLNWMIVRVFVVLPTQYLLQLNTFLFSFFGLTCCARTVRGGGAGAPVPYRIYVDSGVVMLCLFALAPASPLIAAAAFVYFLFCTPLLRWTMIFLYKPKFDIGGQRFVFIFDMCVSGMVVGQILLIAMMALKLAVGPAFAAFCPMIPTIWFRHFVRRRYLRAFNDAALLQTSLLDGWDINEESCEEKREEFRRFLVDCHKAAYVPVCIAGDDTAMITSEPAVVVPLETDEDLEEGSVYGESACGESSKQHYIPTRASQQPGVMARRVSTFQPSPNQPGQMLRRTSAVPIRGVTSQSSFKGNMTDDSSLASGWSSSRYSFGSPRHALRKRVIAPFSSPETSVLLKPSLSGLPTSPLL